MSLNPASDTTSKPRPSAKRPRGRPRIFDEARRQTLCTLISIGLSRKEACRQVGVPPSSVVHAALAFARRLQQSLIDRANRPPELADFGSRSWRAAARRLEARSHYFRRSQSNTHLADRRLKRLIRRMVHKALQEYPAWQILPGDEQRYCSETPHDLRADAVQKQ
jgi:hypothetical protein